ncbi:MAG: c-type cytochrome [Rhodoferax sp.]|nr:c-type cytochrome [Rhodoferax sp.]
MPPRQRHGGPGPHAQPETAGAQVRASHRGRRLWVGAALLSLLLAGGCAVELENRRASQEVARMAEPPGSTYLGWRVFQNKCATCHGPSASGTANGPDLLPRVRDMGSRQFVSVVLQRYDWSQAATQARGDGAALDALVDRIIRRQEYPVNMPAMEGEPTVNAHLVDLYAYLSARATGIQGPGRPTP